MTRYVTTEKQYECCGCGIQCAIREMVRRQDEYCCPSCDQILLIESSLSGYVFAGGALSDRHHESLFKYD